MLFTCRTHSLDPGRRSDRGVTRFGGSGLVVERLSAANLLERRAGRDRRTHALHLTEAGHAVHHGILTARANALSELLRTLPPDERGQLEGLLEKSSQVWPTTGLKHGPPAACATARSAPAWDVPSTTQSPPGELMPRFRGRE